VPGVASLSKWRLQPRAAVNSQNTSGIEPEIRCADLFVKEVDKGITRLGSLREYPVSRQSCDNPYDFCIRIFGHELLGLMIPSDLHWFQPFPPRCTMPRQYDNATRTIRRKKGPVM
jgi:hypothetical protein